MNEREECDSIDTDNRHQPQRSRQTLERKVAALESQIGSQKILLANRVARLAYYIAEVSRWQGKFRTVKHENNKLRAKIYKQKQQ